MSWWFNRNTEKSLIWGLKNFFRRLSCQYALDGACEYNARENKMPFCGTSLLTVASRLGPPVKPFDFLRHPYFTDNLYSKAEPPGIKILPAKNEKTAFWMIETSWTRQRFRKKTTNSGNFNTQATIFNFERFAVKHFQVRFRNTAKRQMNHLPSSIIYDHSSSSSSSMVSVFAMWKLPFQTILFPSHLLSRHISLINATCSRRLPCEKTRAPQE